MKEDEYIVPSGPLKGKKIELAPTAGMEMFEGIAEDFMQRIFNLEAGDYLITDESSLHDFTGVDDMKLPDIHHKIQNEYGLDVSDLKLGNLLEIFVRVHDQASEAE